MEKELEIASSLSELLTAFKSGNMVAILEPIIPFHFELLNYDELDYAEKNVYNRFRIKKVNTKFSKTLWDSLIVLLSINGRLLIYDNGSSKYHFDLDEGVVYYGLKFLDNEFKYNSLNINSRNSIPGLEELAKFSHDPYFSVYDEFILKNALSGEFSIMLEEAPFVKMFSIRTISGIRLFLESELNEEDIDSPDSSSHIFSLFLKERIKGINPGLSHMSLTHQSRHVRKIQEVFYG